MTEQRLVLERKRRPPVIEEGEPPRQATGGIIESRASWDELLELAVAARDVLDKLRLELRDLCLMVDYDWISFRERDRRGYKERELRICRMDAYGIKCKYYSIGSGRLEQIRRLLGGRYVEKLMDVLQAIKVLCSLLDLKPAPQELGGEPPYVDNGGPEIEEGEVEEEPTA